MINLHNKSKIKTNFLVIIFIFLLLEISTISSITAISEKNKIINFQNRLLANDYTLFSPMDSNVTYLIDNNGNIKHSWISEYEPGLSVYMLENGNILRAIHLGDSGGGAVGSGGGIQEMKWDGTIIWDFRYYSSDYIQHHDIEPLPNGNVLLIAKEYKTYSDAIAAGRNPSLLQSDVLSPEYIVEIKPTGPTSGDIVWEWHLWDHLIQDFDASKDNYGVVGIHPELVDINFVTTIQADWIHANSVDYNAKLDQIIISSRNFGEFWIIDHSTTTAEAAGHTGGNIGLGGDILYRWGNPQIYRAGDEEDQKLFGQHDAQWIESGCPGEGNILVFNNGIGRPGLDYSSVEEIIPPIEENGSYYLKLGFAYGPDNSVWVFGINDKFFYSPHISGCQRLINGNTLICSGANGYFFEVTNNKDIVWEYYNYFPNPYENSVFKIRRYKLPFNNPNIPEINGVTSGSSNTSYEYTFTTNDIDGDNIYFYIDWGDGEVEEWIGPVNSGQSISLSHIWKKDDIYTIKVKAKDVFELESDWAYLEVTMPVNKYLYNFVFDLIQKILDIYPRFFPFLRYFNFL